MNTTDSPCCCLFARRFVRGLVVLIIAGAAVISARSLLAEDKADAAKPPEGAVVLFGGKDLAQWQSGRGGEAKWKVMDDGSLEFAPGSGDVITKDKFPGDYKLHVEFMPPKMPDAEGQARGNSGIYISNSYELQVLDSFGIDPPGLGDCAAIYSKKAPDVNAAKPPAQWQSYDIDFKAPRFDADGKKTTNARVTIVWNGKTVHDDYEIDGPCPGGQPETKDGGVIRLQDHGNLVRYRNIWIVPGK